MQKLLITGGSGFIGSNLLNHYINKDFEVLNIDLVRPRDNEMAFCWKKIDLTNREELAKTINTYKPDYILHLAAKTDLRGKALLDYEINYLGTENLINIANNLKCIKRIIFASSMLVCKAGYTPQNETDYAPSTLYGESKVLMEKIIRKTSQSYEWAIVRPTSIWGPGFAEPYRSFFNIVMAEKYFHVSGKSCTKTYGYVENLIHQIDAILHAPAKKIHENIFYLGDYESTNIKLWADEIAEEAGVKNRTIPYPLMKMLALSGDFLRLIGVNFPMTSFRLTNMTTNNIIDLDKTKSIAPNLPFSRAEGIRKTIEWIRKTK